MHDLLSFDAYCFDLDGTIFIGDRLLPGVQDTISVLRQKGKKVMFLTNTSVQTRQECQRRLARLELACQVDEIMTAAYVSGMYFQEHAPNAVVLTVGEEPMKEELRQFDVRITENPLEASHVLVGMDRQFTYEKLHRAAKALRNGAKLIAANPDPCCPVPNDVIPDTGALVKALEAAGEVQLEIVIGKPSAYFADKSLQQLGLPRERCLMVGDRLETDILLGLNNGMKTALVLTGIASREDIDSMQIYPDYVISTLDEMTSRTQGLYTTQL